MINTGNVLQVNVNVEDPFWTPLMELVREKVVPYQWEVLNDRIPGAEKSHCIENFKIAAGLSSGEFYGYVFQDSDFAKWLEAVGYCLMWHEDPALEATADRAIEIVEKAQRADGYLNTYYILTGIERRWTDLRQNHELYCCGHLIEAAIAYYLATGKDKMLSVVKKYVDHICRTFGTEPGKKRGYPGHEIIEMALVKLYRLTGEEKHLALAKYFVDERGTEPNYFIEEMSQNGTQWHRDIEHLKLRYYQADKPVRLQTRAQGHAVRAVYLYSGMADVAKETNDALLARVCARIWDNIAHKQMYLTGGIGAGALGEAFTYEYDLPNDTTYSETCAAIGLIFFSARMLRLEKKGEYADVMERALYNCVISGMSVSGTEYFYVNPLEAEPSAIANDPNKKHVKVSRQPWFSCACCPPNLARIISSVGSYAVETEGNSLFVHLYIAGEYKAQLQQGTGIHFSMSGNYPRSGHIRFDLIKCPDREFTLAFRIPGWCQTCRIIVNGKEAAPEIRNGYAHLERIWAAGDRVELDIELAVQTLRANPNVKEDIGKLAVQRGPIVYCLEEADNGPGLHRIYIHDREPFLELHEPELLGGVTTLTSKGWRIPLAGWNEKLYSTGPDDKPEQIELKWIPYYAWANRQPGQMLVWVNRLFDIQL